MKRIPHGFSLVELLVAVAVFGMMLALAMPSFSIWIQNAKVRTTAESILNALQLARGEAVRRNATIRFQLTDSLATGCALPTAGVALTAVNWVVSFDSPVGKCGDSLFDDTVSAALNPLPRIIQRRPAVEGSSNVVAVSDQVFTAFNGLGRAAPAPATIDIQPASGCTNYRCLRVTVSSGGQIRLCDPAFSTTGSDPQRC